MTVARLTAALLAPKGTAQPLHGVYEHPMQKPALSFAVGEPRHELKAGWAAGPSPGRFELRAKPSMAAPSALRFRLSCSIDRDQHRQLRILAARQGGSIQDVLRQAIDAHIKAARRDCACMSGTGGAGCACDRAAT